MKEGTAEMKRTIVILGCFGVVLTLLLAVFCYEPGKNYEGDIKRILCIINPGNCYWDDVKRGAEMAEEELGGSIKYCIFTRLDLNEQLRMLQETDYTQVDGVITQGEPYAPELNEKIASIVRRGIPVVLVDTDSKESNRSCYIGSNNYMAGQLAAQEIVKQMGEAVNIVILVSELENANQKERINGFKDVIRQYPEMRILEIYEGNKLSTQEKFREILEMHKDLDAIFCAEASSSYQIGIELEKEKPQRDICVIGFDRWALKFVEEGVFAATIVQDSFGMGYQAVAYLTEYGEEMSDKSEIFTEVRCVTKEEMQKSEMETDKTQGE